MIICYLLILLAILTNGLITVSLRGSDADKLFAKRLGSRVRYVVWFFGPGLFTFLFVPKKYLFVPFICIILPSVIALGIRALVERYKYQMARRRKPRDVDSDDADETGGGSSGGNDMEMSEIEESEDDPPTLIREAYEIDTRKTALAGEIRKQQQVRPRSTSYGSEESIGTSES